VIQDHLGPPGLKAIQVRLVQKVILEPPGLREIPGQKAIQAPLGLKETQEQRGLREIQALPD
jgi:hypothetical protein